MSDVTLVAAGAVVSGTGSGAIDWPAGLAVKDVGLLIIETANEGVSIAGWTQIGTQASSGTGTAGDSAATRLSMWWRRYLTAGDIAQVTFSDPGNHYVGQILVFRNCAVNMIPVEATSQDVEAVGSTSVTMPSIMTTGKRRLAVFGCSTGTDLSSSQFSGWANANLESIAELANTCKTSGNGGGFGVASGVLASAGASGVATANLANSSTQGRVSFGFLPQPVAFDTDSGPGTAVDWESGDSVSWSHTCGDSSDRLLVVQVAVAAPTGASVAAMTYNGTAMSLVTATEESGGGVRLETWMLVNPSVGTHTLSVTLTASRTFRAHAISYHGVDQASPIGTVNSGSGTASSFVTSETSTTELSGVLFSFAVIGDNSWSGGSGATVTVTDRDTATTSVLGMYRRDGVSPAGVESTSFGNFTTATSHVWTALEIQGNGLVSILPSGTNIAALIASRQSSILGA